MSHINQITLTLNLTIDGLVGEDVEYGPSLAHYLTTGQHRAQQKVAMPTPTGGILQLVYKDLPPLATLDGSENFKFEVLSLSRYSLVPEIDGKERQHNEYTVNSGRISLPLHEVLEAAGGASLLTRAFVEPMLLDQEVGKGQLAWLNNLSPLALQTATLADFRATAFYKRIVAQCRKGTLYVTKVQVDNVGALPTYLGHLRQSLAQAERPDGPLNVNTQRFARELEAHNDLFQAAYMEYYVMSLQGNRPPRFDARANMPEARMLHLTLDRHQDGHRPAVHYFRNRTATELKDYAFSQRSVAFFESMFGSALLTVGMSKDQFIQAVQQQANTTTATLHAETVRALRGLSYFCAKAAHTIYYSMDVSYKNPALAARNSEETNGGSIASRLHQQCLTLFGRSYCRSKLFRDNGKAEAMAQPFQEPSRVTDYVVLGDRFSKDTVTGVSNTGDCDDMGGGNAMNNYLTPRQIQAQLGKGVSALLDAYVRLTDFFVPFGAGSMVTSAYFDESKNAVMSLDDRRAILDLPLKNSAAYQQAETGGHCHLLLVPRPMVAAELQRAGQFSNVLIAKVLGVASLDAFLPWEHAQPKVLVEGTGQVDGLSVLGASEVHPSLASEATALRGAKKLIQQSCPILRENFRGLAGNFYAERPANPDRATNSFFRVFEHLLAPTLYDADPRMGHFVVCDMSDRSRGVDAENYLRSGSRSDATVALVSHMADQPRNVLDAREALYACIDRQQALNITYRFKEDFTHANHLATGYDMAMSRIGHMIGSLSLFNGMTMTDLRLQLDKHALGSWTAAAAKQQLLANGGGDGVVVVTATPEADRLCQPQGRVATLTLFVRPWHLIEMDREGLTRELQWLRQQGVVADMDPVLWHERPLAACDDMLTLCMPLVKK